MPDALPHVQAGPCVSVEDLLIDAAESHKLVRQDGGVEDSDVSDVTIAVDAAHIAWMPDSSHLLFTTVDSGAALQAWIECIDIETGKINRLVKGSSPRPSPDGKRVAYIGLDGQLWMCDRDGTGARALTELAHGFYLGIPAHGTFAFAPDSRTLAMAHLSTRPGDPSGSMELCALNVDTMEKTFLYSAIMIDGVRWTQDGSRIVFAAGEVPLADVELIALDPSTGNHVRLARKIGPGSLTVGPSPSPDSTWVAFFQDPSGGVVPEFFDLAVVPLDGGSVRSMTRNVYVTNIIGSSPQWLPGGETILFSSKSAALERELCKVSMTGEIRFLHSRLLEKIGIWALSPDGGRIAFRSSDPQAGKWLRVVELEGFGERYQLNLTPNHARGRAKGAVEEVCWNSTDGLKIAGLLIRPVNEKAGIRYPLIVDVHGGPHGGVGLGGAVLLSSALEWHYWAGRGYAVFIPDYRDSRVYGHDRVAALSREEADRLSVEDILSGVDHVIESGLADPDRLAILGHSHGAHLVNHILIRTDRFRFALSKEGGVDESVIAAADKVNTPLLLVSAGKWKGVEQCKAFAKTLESRGISVEHVNYANDEHVLVRPGNQRDLLNRVIRWMGAFLSVE